MYNNPILWMDIKWTPPFGWTSNGPILWMDIKWTHPLDGHQMDPTLPSP